MLSAPVWLLLGLGHAQSRIGDWRHFAPIIDAQALSYYDGRVYAATDGGVLIYDLAQETFTTFGLDQGLVYPDLRSIFISGEWMWLGGGEPRGVIQLVNLSTGAVEDPVELDIDVITQIVATTDRGFAAFRKGQEAGIIELRWDGRRFAFRDSYKNFPISVGDILDLDLFGDSLFVTTRAGVLGNNFVRANLQDPLTWTRSAPAGVDAVRQYHVDSTGHYLQVPTHLYYRGEEGWQDYGILAGYSTRHLFRRANGDFVISTWDYLQILPLGGGSSGGTPLIHRGRPITGITEADGQLFAAVKGRALARYNAPSRTWTSLIPNSMAGPGYTALLKLDTGELVAAGLGGITRLRDGSWYNIIPSFHLGLEPEVDRVHGDAQETGSDRFLADTLFFRGKQSWNIVQLPDGDIMVGFKGNLPAAGGILRLNFDDVGEYIIYDTAGGQLDGLASDGYITVRHMAVDRHGNAWIANPFGELHGNSLAVLQPDGPWTHFSVAESGNRLNLAPTEIAFDNLDRVWVGSEVRGIWGNGGIAVLDYGPSLEDKSDDLWKQLSAKLEADDSNTVWSLVFDQQQVLWIVSPAGVMGYNVVEAPNLALIPFTNFGPFLSDIPFVEGSKIRVDAQNNKWISTPTDGFWVLLDNTTFWPSVEGFNSRNSPLPSDEILDIYLDDEEGVAYIATSKGISSLKMPFRQELVDYSGMVIFPSPYRIPSDSPLVVDQVRQGSSVKVFTIGGRLVKELDVEGYQAFWDGKNGSGDLVGSGVYLITAYLSSGRTGVGKVAVIRR